MPRQSKPELVVVAALAYVPFLLSSPGRVSADSKQYLYLDPARFLGRSVDLWDPAVGAGTVPHQHLGYAFPVGPFYWALDRLGLPDWIAQRLWLGTLTFLAAAGARWLFQQLGTGRAGALAGALIYGFTPYQLAFTARISVLLMPWAALPWLVGLTVRATRTRDWRAPAALGLVLVLAGGINASSLLLVGLGPLLWVVVEAAQGRAQAVAAWRAAGRVAIVGIGVSAWWLVGVRLQSTYGLPILQLTENVRTVAERSTPGDVLRGLGNWFFYGRDRTGYSLDQAAAYDSNGLVVALSYAVPVAGLVAALVVRWAHRAYFGLLVIVGLIVAVGAWPVDEPSPYGRVWQAFTTDTSLGLAFRNSPRAVPIIVLGFAGLLAAAVGSLPRVRWEQAGAGFVAAVALGALLPVWQDGYLSGGLDRPEELPAYWLDAVADLNAGDPSTRVLEVPGVSFAAYRWGNLVDPLTPGLTDRPYLAREVLPHGTPPSVNLVDALDRRMQLGITEAASIAPIARLLGAGTISLRADLDQSGRYDSPSPTAVWRVLNQASGLASPRTYGPPGGDGADPELPSVALFDVAEPRSIVRTAATESPIVLAGDGDGIVDAAAAGLIDGHGLLLQSPALDDAALDRALDAGAHLILTDSNRRRIQTWFYGLRDTRGPTERAGRNAPDPTGYDFRLDPFPGSSDDTRTVVEQIGGQVEVTSEGGPDRPEDRGAHAVDGDPATAWRVGGPDPRGQTITLVPEEPVTVDEVRLVQPASARTGRALARVRIVLDGREPLEVDLGEASLDEGGQAVSFPRQTVRSIRIEVVATTGGGPTAPLTPVGLAEIGLGSTRVAEVVRLPVDLLERVGADLDGHGLDVVLTRLRLDLPGSDRQDDEPLLDRRFELPLARAFTLAGTARVPLDAGDGATDGLDICREDVISVDGRPVAVRVTGHSGRTPTELVLAGCEAIALGPGAHRLTARAGASTGFDVDRIVLATDGEGQPAPVAPRGARDTSIPRVRVLDAGATTLDVEVAAATEPFWLVLGQSASDGWTASADGARVGTRTLVDGHANGWLITPDGSGTIAIELRWGPQRLVWAGLALSALAIVGCVLVLVAGRRRSQPQPRQWSAFRPPARLLLTAAPARPAAAVTSGVLMGLGAALVTTPLVAVVVLATTLVAALAPRGRLVFIVVAPTALVLSRVAERPSLAWLAAAVLAADLLLGRHDLREPGSSA